MTFSHPTPDPHPHDPQTINPMVYIHYNGDESETPVPPIELPTSLQTRLLNRLLETPLDDILELCFTC